VTQSGKGTKFSLMILCVYKSSISPSLFSLYHRIYTHGSPLCTIATPDVANMHGSSVTTLYEHSGYGLYENTGLYQDSE